MSPAKKAANKRWRVKNRKTVNAINYRSKKRHWKRVLAARNRRNHEIKQIVLRKYGKLNGCVCCGEQRLEFLTLDHVKDDGASDRKLNGRAGWQLYRLLKTLGYPKGFQTLCFNCNWGKRLGKGFCPHHPRRDLRKPR